MPEPSDQVPREPDGGQQAVVAAILARKLTDGKPTPYLWEIAGEVLAALDVRSEGEPNGAAIEQRLENEQVRQMQRTGRCPVCGADAP